MTPLLCLWIALTAAAADVDEAEALFRAGKYDECARMAAEEIAGADGWSERWRILKIAAEMRRGKYPEAMDSLDRAVRRFSASIPLRLMAIDVYRFNGRQDEVPRLLESLENVVMGSPQRFATPEGLIALGRYFLLTGRDSRKVLDLFYDPALKREPTMLEGYFATAELALAKQDYALAADSLRKAPKSAAQDPRYHYLLASAYSPEDRTGSDKELAEGLKLNPNHVDSLLLLADHQIDSEKYDEAAKLLKHAHEVNPHEPRAFAYLAVLAHLRNDADGESAARKMALAKWAGNPEVDHIIGRKLSQKYRFAEGSAYQRKSLELDREYQPAKLQLCQDLLRLGEESDGWKLAAEIFAADPYNVVAFNLSTLHDRISTFRTLKGDGFLVRMDPREAELYGHRVLDLLARARKTLGERYGATPPSPVIVEIFPQRKEFAVRTFGLPGADGLLGVCFGRVITANSPASQGASPSNWEAVLWHEFCHVVTLSKTRNKMPRWLSEGISVYEEERADPSWATTMNPTFREMILGKELTPLSQLSGAFLNAKSALDLQFAYFESSLAVAFLVEAAGLPSLQGLLDDLGSGLSMNEALPRRTKISLKELDDRFARFARDRANGVAANVTWEEPEIVDADSAKLEAWLGTHPKSFHGWRLFAARLVQEGKLGRAKGAIKTLRSMYPEYVGPENAYMLQAALCRKQSDPSGERQALEELVARDGGASPAYLRLLELELAAKDWKTAARDARRLLAINPLIAAPYRALARASEQLGDPEGALEGYRSVVLLDDSDPAEIHYRLARILQHQGRRDMARREVLKSLEEAPRFQDALKLLLELVESPGETTNPSR
jgi:tetratricopeptide (TPR) repeat protein